MSCRPVEKTSVGIVRTRLSQNLRRNCAGSDQDDVADRKGRDRDFLSAGRSDPFRGVRQQLGECGEGPAGLSDGAHLQPVAEEHDRDEAGEFPPDLHVE